MILSVSRRTDIPAFYADWFFRRIEEGYVCVRNPKNIHQVSRIAISPDVTDCIVFWTKNAAPMLGRLGELDRYSFYFQFTVNAYGTDAEPNVPPLDERIAAFRKLSELIGKERVIWRYDPIFFSHKYDIAYHLDSFRYISERLSGYTEKCVFSFVDIYASKNMSNMAALGQKPLPDSELGHFIEGICAAAAKAGLKLATCAEKIDLSGYGIEHNSCIDGTLIERIIGYRIAQEPDGQRNDTGCGCIKCRDIGSYDTCPHGCVYCYANYRPSVVNSKTAAYDPDSPLLCDRIDPAVDRVTDSQVKSLRSGTSPDFTQINFF